MNTKLQKVFAGLGIALITILSIILIFNLIIVLKSFIKKDKAPSVFGITPLIVTSGSMTGDNKDSFPVNSMIFVKKTKFDKLDENDVISFYEINEKTGKTSVISHRIYKINEDGTITTKGDANNSDDGNFLTSDLVIGKVMFHIKGIGSLALFMKEPIGIIVTISIPVILYLLVDLVLSKGKKNKKENNDSDSESLNKE